MTPTRQLFSLHRDISVPVEGSGGGGSFCFKLACLPHRGCSLLEVEGSLSQRQKLTAEVSALAEEEQKLEQLIQRCSQDMRHMSDSASNQKYPFFVFSRRFILRIVTIPGSLWTRGLLYT